MRKLYFIYSKYSPNNASCNRSLAYLKSLSFLQIEVSVIFLLPDSQFSKMTEEFPGISVEYCWDRNYINYRFIKNLSYIQYLYSIYRRVIPNDVVYIYGDYDLMWLFLHKKGVRVFYESTEHPLIYPPKGRILRPSINTFLKYCRKLEGLFVISTCLQKYYVDSGVPSDRVTIVNAFVDTTRFDRIKKQDCSSPYFAYCGNGNNRKDKVDKLILAFSHISNRFEDVRLLIIGPTKQVFKNEKDNVILVRELGLEKKVIFTGVKPAEEIPQLLVNATALFLTRPDTLQNRAGFSTKLCEYLASGNPVVAAEVGDIGLFLKDKENAFVFNPGDFKAVEDIMEFILTHPTESRQIGEMGRKTATHFFNALHETKKVITAFDHN